MAVAYGTTGTWRADTNPTATSAAFNVPASVASGDGIFVHFRHNPSVAVIGTITPPAGFTNVMGAGNTAVARVTGSAGGQDRDYFCFWKLASGADSGTYSFSWSGGSSIVPGVAIRYTGVAGSGALVDGTPGNSTHITATTTRGPCSCTTTTANTLLIWCCSNQNTSAGDTPPASFSANRSGSQGQFAVFDKALAAAGSSGSLSGSTGSSIGVSYVLAIPSVAVGGGAVNLGLLNPLQHHMEQQDNGLYAPSRKLWTLDAAKRREILLADDHRARELLAA